MQKFKTKLSALRPLRPFLLLWSTQALSALGSGMTSFALVIWAYGQSGSALSTALLSICSYAPGSYSSVTWPVARPIWLP